MNAYITSDVIGTQTGGGAVTYHESLAMKELGPCQVWDRDRFGTITSVVGDEPWYWDLLSETILPKSSKLAHFYAGTFSNTISAFKNKGVKVSYTAAAHDIQSSKKAHEELSVPFDYPHLTDPKLWARYVEGYLDADTLIVPSTHSRDVMIYYGADPKRIAVIPHGCDIPEEPLPLPKRFTVGYLGAYGPDKGVKTLLQAWDKLNYTDADLVLAGRQSKSPFVSSMIRVFCPNAQRSVYQVGWQEDLAGFYGSISLYVQPSITEGFGIEVLESMSHGRLVLCSAGAGACDVLSPWDVCFSPGDSAYLASMIDFVKKNPHNLDTGIHMREEARHYTWPIVREAYKSVWKEML